MNMMAIKFDLPPVQVTDSGALRVSVDDIFHSRAGQDLILRMARMKACADEGCNYGWRHICESCNEAVLAKHRAWFESVRRPSE